MKKIFTSLMSLALVASLTACSGSSAGKSSQTASGSAGSGNSITVYSPHPAETINLLVQEFENKTGIKVDIVAAGTGELLKRVESEKDNPLGDVLWGGGAESLQAYTLSLTSQAS